jgi:hypothetical protein
LLCSTLQECAKDLGDGCLLDATLPNIGSVARSLDLCTVRHIICLRLHHIHRSQACSLSCNAFIMQA